MNSPAQTQSNESGEHLDLAALGQTWTPPQQLDATPEVSDILAELPWWVSRGLLYLISSFVVVALLAPTAKKTSPR